MTKKPVIEITAGHMVKYSMNNIVSSEFDDRELYEVPDHVARGMVAHGWAKLSFPSPSPAQPQPSSDDDESSTRLKKRK